MYYLENNINNTFKPSLIVIVDMDEDFSTKRAGTRRIDPTTGKVYYLEDKNEGEINAHIKERLIVKNEDKKNVRTIQNNSVFALWLNMFYCSFMC